MTTVFLGTSAFAATVLERLAESPHRPALVVTRPDRPRGRGRRVASPPVADTARALGLALDQPDSVNAPEARARIAATAPDAVIVCAFGALIKEPLLSEHPMLNVHPSLLPRWRGAAPVERAIMAGDAETGVAIMRVTAGLDSGPVCLMRPEPIRPDDTYGTLAPRLEALGAALLVEALDTSPPFVEQDDALATYAEKIDRDVRSLAPETDSAEVIERIVRALSPHIGARLDLAGAQPLGVRRARLAAVEDPPAPGRLAARDGALVLGARDGALVLDEVQPAGKRPMAGADYLRGHALQG